MNPGSSGRVPDVLGLPCGFLAVNNLVEWVDRIVKKRRKQGAVMTANIGWHCIK